MDVYRHSGKFYDVLSTTIRRVEVVDDNAGRAKPLKPSFRHISLLTVLAKCCTSSDPATRKFASFAGVLLSF